MAINVFLRSPQCTLTDVCVCLCVHGRVSAAGSALKSTEEQIELLERQRGLLEQKRDGMRSRVEEARLAEEREAVNLRRMTEKEEQDLQK